MPHQHEARLVQKYALNPTVLHLMFESQEKLTYQPGQYASLIIGNHRRLMSFATPPAGTRGEFLIDTSPGGVASRWAENLTPNETFVFLSPYGRFTVEEQALNPRVFIATGTGIGPIRAQLLASDFRIQTTLIFGTHDSSVRFFDHEFETLANRYPAFTFLPVSRQNVAEIALQYIPNLAQSIFYICGGPTRVKETVQILEHQGIPASQIRTEQFLVVKS